MFGAGGNTTEGLPVVRTSVDHGTTFDKAGKSVSNPQSLVDAYQMAVLLCEELHWKQVQSVQFCI